MSVLTKVFVVLVTVLSILLVALVVPFVAKTEDYRAQKVESDKRADAAMADARLKQSLLDAAQSSISQNISDLNHAKTNLETQLVALNEKLADAEARSLKSESARAKYEADFSRLTAAEQQHAEIIKALESELAQRRTAMSTLQTQVIQLADRIKETEGQLQAAERQRRRDAEQLVRYEEDNAKLQKVLASVPPEARGAGGTTPTTAIEPATPIQAQVTKVASVEGDTFVQVNAGKNDGVQENMKFLIHRGDQYLGSLVITNVDANASSGRMILEKGPLAVGDQALTGGR